MLLRANPCDALLKVQIKQIRRAKLSPWLVGFSLVECSDSSELCIVVANTVVPICGGSQQMKFTGAPLGRCSQTIKQTNKQVREVNRCSSGFRGVVVGGLIIE
jgi:hypothetical protein